MDRLRGFCIFIYVYTYILTYSYMKMDHFTTPSSRKPQKMDHFMHKTCIYHIRIYEYTYIEICFSMFHVKHCLLFTHNAAKMTLLTDCRKKWTKRGTNPVRKAGSFLYHNVATCIGSSRKKWTIVKLNRQSGPHWFITHWMTNIQLFCSYYVKAVRKSNKKWSMMKRKTVCSITTYNVIFSYTNIYIYVVC